MATIDDAVMRFGQSCKEKLGPGQGEAALRAPLEQLLRDCGTVIGRKVVPHDEVSELDGSVRPDFAINVDGLISGHIELKAPGVTLDPASYGRSTHNYKQWQKLKELPNLIYTNGIEWRLWRNGQLVGQPVHLVGGVTLQTAGAALKPVPAFEQLLSDFLAWQPVPIRTVGKLVESIAPLTRLLKEQIHEGLQEERRRVKAGADKDDQTFLGLLSDWRNTLFPRATDLEFADGFAQTITFALLLAQTEGIDLKSTSLHEIGKALDAHEHSLMGKSLQTLTNQLDAATLTAIQLLVRIISVIDWPKIRSLGTDTYLHLYEHFLSEYDGDSRRRTGSYYTPYEVVEQMVRLTEDVLAKVLGKTQKFRDPSVNVVDPAVGTGTFPLSILSRTAEQAALEHGPGAAPEALTSLAARLYGFEIQSGPYSVAELRFSDVLNKYKARHPDGGINLFITNTLDDPEAKQTSLSSELRLIARQGIKANKVKREKNVTVVIGNPPYKEKAKGMGSWVENGNGLKSSSSLMDDFRSPSSGVHGKHLKNLYVYFYRWAFWKAFESTALDGIKEGDAGVVTFITAAGYLRGPGFDEMRRYIRQTCSQGWLIDLTPEGKRPPTETAVFAIETPVVIGIFVRKSETDTSTPATIKFTSLSGTRKMKFQSLSELELDGPGWLDVRSDWTAPFTPVAADWDSLVAIKDLFPWYSSGVQLNRTWPCGPTPQVLEERWRTLCREDSLAVKREMFKENVSTNLTAVPAPLAGVESALDTKIPLKDELGLLDPPIERFQYRSFDRQWVIADSRVIHRPRRDLWNARVPGQVFTMEANSHVISTGPGLTFSSLVPETDAFRANGASRVSPLLNPDGSPNLADGFPDAMAKVLGTPVSAADVISYIAGVVSHTGFTNHFAAELETPGIRVPFTADKELWDEAVQLGAEVVWLHSYGELFHDRFGKDVKKGFEGALPSYQSTVAEMPETKSYDPQTRILKVGTSGAWHDVAPEVASYDVGGSNILDLWFKFRQRNPKGRKGSSLDDINQSVWPAEWSQELTELLVVLTRLRALETKQASLLKRLMDGPILTKDSTELSSVKFGASKIKPKYPMISTADQLALYPGA